MKNKILLTICLLGLSLSTMAQNISVVSAEGQSAAAFLSSHLFGSNMSISNVRFNQADTIGTPQIGTFTSNGYTNLGIDLGVVLTTGNISVAPGPNNSNSNSSPISGYYSDSLMADYCNGAVYSSATIDLDFTSIHDSLVLYYVFASEEYPEYVCASFSDGFIILLTGPDPVTGDTVSRNIAIIPGTVSETNPDGIAVAINTVNQGISSYSSGSGCYLNYSEYYVSNHQPGATGGPNNADGIQYDGHTTRMEARATLIPGATYHLHISICNTGDNAYDSGLFLEGASTFCSSVANVSVNNITGHNATAVWQKPSDEDSLYYVMVDGVLDSIISNDSTLVYQMNNLQDDTTHSFGVGIPCINGDTIWAQCQFVTPAVIFHINVIADSIYGSATGSGDYHEGCTAVLCALPQSGVFFEGWAEDTIASIISGDNPLSFTVLSDRNLMAVYSPLPEPVTDTVYITLHDTIFSVDTVYLIDTIYSIDTIYIHDTINVGVDSVDAINLKVYSQYSQIVIEGADGNDVAIYDAVGRRIALRRDNYGILRFDVHSSGTYLVRIGNHPARKIVVVK